jgi:hypothetical protein
LLSGAKILGHVYVYINKYPYIYVHVGILGHLVRCPTIQLSNNYFRGWGKRGNKPGCDVMPLIFQADKSMTQEKSDFAKRYDRSRQRRRLYTWLRQNPDAKVSAIRRAMGISNTVVAEILRTGMERSELIQGRGFWNSVTYSLRPDFDITSVRADTEERPISVIPTPVTPVQPTPTPASVEFTVQLAGLSKAGSAVPQPELQPDPQPVLPLEMEEAIAAAREMGRRIAAELLDEYKREHPPAEPTPAEPKPPELPRHTLNPQAFLVGYGKR